jgi:hypothetical protein
MHPVRQLCGGHFGGGVLKIQRHLGQSTVFGYDLDLGQAGKGESGQSQIAIGQVQGNRLLRAGRLVGWSGQRGMNHIGQFSPAHFGRLGITANSVNEAQERILGRKEGLKRLGPRMNLFTNQIQDLSQGGISNIHGDGPLHITMHRNSLPGLALDLVNDLAHRRVLDAKCYYLRFNAISSKPNPANDHYDGSYEDFYPETFTH